MMVTKKTASGTYVSYHSTDNLGHPLSEIEGRYPKQTRYFYFKVWDLVDAEKPIPVPPRPDYTD